MYKPSLSRFRDGNRIFLLVADLILDAASNELVRARSALRGELSSCHFSRPPIQY